jgi:hypothetical protein
VSDTRISVSGRIAAPASELFQIVSSPAGHVEIDGSGMLVSPLDATPPTKVGDTFDMEMDREPLGDIPDMGRYKVRNTVTQIVPDRLFEWGIGFPDGPMIGHVYGWQLEPITETETEVTNYCDWSGLPEAMQGPRWPIVPRTMLEQSLENLQRIATER